MKLDEEKLKKYGWKKETDTYWIHELKSTILQSKDIDRPSKGFSKVKLQYHIERDVRGKWWLLLMTNKKSDEQDDVIGEIELNDTNINSAYKSKNPSMKKYNQIIEYLGKMKFIK